jgi:serine/threonine protein kinase HipA of HipAB toxin-antitoxin module
MRAQMQGEIAGMRTGAMRDIAAQRSEDTRRGQDVGLQKTEKTVSASMERFRKAQEGIQGRFEQRFAQAERKIADAKTKSEKAAELSTIRQAELDRRAAAANAIKAAAAGMDMEELKKLEEEERATRDEADRKIDQLTMQSRESKPSSAPAPPAGKPLNDTVKQQMQEAVSKGKTREEVIAKAREMGYDVSGF